MAKRDRMSGNEAVATAMRQINPDVMGAFPITPSTEIPQYYSQYIADGRVDTEFVAGRVGAQCHVGVHRSIGSGSTCGDGNIFRRAGIHVGAALCGCFGEIAYHHGGGKPGAHRTDQYQ